MELELNPQNCSTCVYITIFKSNNYKHVGMTAPCFGCWDAGNFTNWEPEAMEEKEKLNEVLETLQKLYFACEDITVYENPDSMIPAMIKAEEVYKKYTKNNIFNVKYL